MRTKKTSEQIKDRILEKLKDGPITITEVSESINSNWLTTEKFLKELKEDNLVSEIIFSPKMKIYRRTDDPVYYGLPFSKEVRNKTIYVLLRVLEEWKKQRGIYPSKTTTQKIAVKTIIKCNLDLPVLEFHYGKVTCASITPDQNIEKVYHIVAPEEAEKIKKCIKEIIKDKSHTGRAYKERRKQYEEEGMKFYSAKEDLVKSFDDKNNELDIVEKLHHLSINFPVKLQEFYSEFNDFISISTTLLSVKNKGEEEKDNLRKIKETFYLLWDILTTLAFFIDSKKYVSLQKKEILNQIKEFHINLKKMSYGNLLTELESELINVDFEEIKMPEGDESIEIQKLIRESLEA